MGKRCDQLDLDDRIEISGLHAAGISRRRIGHLMGGDASLSRDRIVPKLKWLGQWLLVFVLIYAIVDYFSEDSSIFATIGELEPWVIGTIVVLQFNAVALHSYRIFLIIKRLSQRKVNYLIWLDIFVVGRALTLITAQLGNLYRAHALKKKFQFEYSNYAASLGLFAWADTAANLALAAAVFLATPVAANASVTFAHLLIALGLWLAAAPIGTVALRRAMHWSFVPHSFRQQAEYFLNGFWSAARDVKVLSRLLLLGLLSFINLLAIFMILFWALGADAALHKMVVILILYKLSLVIVITPGNLGVREWTIGGACALVGIEPGIGLISSLLIRAAQVVALTATIGVIRARRAIADRVDSYGIRK